VHSTELQSFASLSSGRNRQDAEATDVRSGHAGLTWAPTPGLTLTAGLHGEDTHSPQFDMHASGVDGSVNWEQALPLGRLQASYSLRYDLRDQTAAQTQPTVVGERVVLTGTTPVALSRTNVIGSSVVVSNLTRTQVYVEGSDYILTVVGLTTRIERVLAGNILDRQELLVDYSFDIGGSYESTQRDQTISLNWALSRNLSAYFRYGDSVPRVRSGEPATPLNTIHATLVGMRGEVPVSFPIDLQLGGFLEGEDRRETIAPFRRTQGEFFVQGDLPFQEQVDFRATVRRMRVVADNVLQNVDLTGYDLSIGWRPSYGFNVSADAFSERDVAGPELRERRMGTLRALWRFRKLSLTANLSRTRETQGTYVRERSAGNFNLRREF
jgi:hypothetical protein